MINEHKVVMVIDDLEKYFEDQEKQMELLASNVKTTFNDGMTYDQCDDELQKYFLYFGHHTLKPWDYFVKVYDEIPKKHRLKIQLESIYISYHFRPDQFFEYLARTLHEESIEERKRRQLRTKRQLKQHLDDEGYLTVWRGSTDESMDEYSAISYTLDKEKAAWFASRYDKPGQKVESRTIPCEDVLFYTNSRNEQEVMVISQYLEDLLDELGEY